jgi:hypothetical protein
MAVLTGIRATTARRRIAIALSVSLTIGFLLSGWFYLSLHHRYGSVTATNRPSMPSFRVSNQPRSFYVDLGWPHLFEAPVRDAFPNRLLPIFYSEVWGDYWGYFLVFGRDTRSDRWLSGPEVTAALAQASPPDWLRTNRGEMAAYLGRVNAVSVPASLLAVLAVVAAVPAFGRLWRRAGPDRETSVTCLLLLLMISAYAGYFWFLILYPNTDKGNTIKATYMLHTFPFVAVLVGRLLERLRDASPGLPRAAAVVLVATVLHNLPAMLTRFRGL